MFQPQRSSILRHNLSFPIKPNFYYSQISLIPSCGSVSQLSHSVMSDSLQPHGLQHTCLSSTPKSNSPEIYTTKRKKPINTEIIISWEPKSPLQIQPVHPKGDQPCVFTGRTDVETVTPILWPPDAKSWLFWKDPDAGKDWRLEEMGMTGDEMVGWHHRLNGHEFG